MNLDIDKQLLGNFTEYADYVNNERAITHYYDGLKPVMRRSLYTLHKMGLTPEKQTKKFATVVGKVMEYHPHGDSGIYNAMIRGAQPFSNLIPIIHGSGNIGSLDMGPAAMRYTEVKLTPFGHSLVKGLKDKIVPMVPSYDGTEVEPSFLPVPVPYLLVNGSSGIGVGMAASIPSHNLVNVIDMTSHYILNPSASTSDLVDILQGPDFSSGCDIVNKEDFKGIYTKGSGGFKMRAKFSITGSQITASNLPYKTSGSRILEQLNAAQDRGECTFIREVIDMSSEEEVVLINVSTKDMDFAIKEICRASDLEKTFSLDFSVVLESPRRVTLLDFTESWVRTHKELNRQRLKQEEQIALARLHILEGLLKATKMMDEVIKTIRASQDTSTAKMALISLGFSEPQSKAILDMKLAKLTKLNELSLEKEAGELDEEVLNLQSLLNNEDAFNLYLIEEMSSYKKMASPRKSKLTQNVFAKAVKSVDTNFHVVYNKAKMKAIITGGVSSKAINGNASSPIYILHENKVTPIKNAKDPVITSVWDVIDSSTLYALHFSEDGFVKKTRIEDLKTSRTAIVAKQDKVVSVLITSSEQNSDMYVLLTLNNGKNVQFNIDDINSTGRNARGVGAVKLNVGEKVESAVWSQKIKDVPVGRNKKLK